MHFEDTRHLIKYSDIVITNVHTGKEIRRLLTFLAVIAGIHNRLIAEYANSALSQALYKISVYVLNIASLCSTVTEIDIEYRLWFTYTALQIYRRLRDHWERLTKFSFWRGQNNIYYHK